MNTMAHSLTPLHPNWQLSSIAELEKSSKYIPPERVVLWKTCLSERKEDKSRMECPQTINKFQHLLFHGALGVSIPPPPPLKI